MHMYIYIYIYIYIHIHRHKQLRKCTCVQKGDALAERADSTSPVRGMRGIRKGTTGVSTNGVTANSFWFWLFVHNLSAFITFAAAPLVLTPFVRNQGILRKGAQAAAFCQAMKDLYGDLTISSPTIISNKTLISMKHLDFRPLW